MTTTTLNITHADCGCYVDGHWGNYALSRMLEITDGILGSGFYAQAERAWRETPVPVWTGYRYVDGPTPEPDEEWDDYTFDGLAEIAAEAETALNNATPEGLLWHWHDGEFFLSPLCDDEDTCTDETCAHWAWC